MTSFEYAKICIFFLIACVIVLTLVFLPKFLNKKNVVLINTFRPVECGSQSFGSGKNRIEIIFYRVLIVFIIFEVEILVLLPLLVNFHIIIGSHALLFLFLILTVDVCAENAEGPLLVQNTRINILIISFVLYFLCLLLNFYDPAIFNLLSLTGSATIFFSIPLKPSQPTFKSKVFDGKKYSKKYQLDFCIKHLYEIANAANIAAESLSEPISFFLDLLKGIT